MRAIKITILVVVGILVVWGWTTYNGFITKQENMTRAWSQVDNVYQRRADLVPNLVALVKSYTKHEQGTLIAVTEARARAASVKVDTDEFDDLEFASYESAQRELGNSINRVLVEVENYPDLKASDNYLTLQAQLAGCENRILTERERFNEAAKDYNQSIRKFPGNLIANLCGFERRPYFEADAGSEKAPETF
ncbi:MAG: LemA family protein [Bacteroidales bacterium]|jgi:LemA protein|nr:LemA family protein [Bacteroidales bacterium]